MTVHHPEYLTSNTEHLDITEASDVWVTMVSTNSNFRYTYFKVNGTYYFCNTIGFYTYPTNSPPATKSDITEVKYIFPNALATSSGTRVKIGTFSAGTSIGFFFSQNSWNSMANTINPYSPKFYSDSRFNPESSNSLKSHSVFLNFASENQFIIGFEEDNREDVSSDDDFNDVIIHATSNPVSAISTAGLTKLGSVPADLDGDGVLNATDEFPNDATKAYTSYYPSKNTKGTLAFEDNWPAKGDYDMNDLVVKYRYTYVYNANNKVVEMTGDFSAVAAFAVSQNGFGVQFPFSPNLISSVSGQKTSSNLQFNTNGTEMYQQKAVIIPFDNHNLLIQNNINIVDSARVTIKFTTPIDYVTLGNAPYNPFLFNRSDNTRREVHLPGYQPTENVTGSFFGTQDDNSNYSLNRFYLSPANWPWAMSFTESFSYPKEGIAINDAYLRFGDWATSGGTQYSDWYSNSANTYRNPANIH
jgi:LruC domain-containing protein